MAVLVLLAGCDAPAPRSEAVVPVADLVLTNGRIYTQNSAQPWAEAVAITGGKFVFVGTNAEALKLRGATTALTDLGGRFAMPGLIDSHVHPALGGIEQFQCSFAPTATPADIAARIAECIAAIPDAPWIVGGRWDSGLFTQHDLGSPREWLDRVSGDKAVSLADDTGHNRWVNSKALRLAGLDDPGKTIEGGTIVRDPSTGKANGLLLESAMLPVLAAIPELTPAQYQQAARTAFRAASRHGITGIKEAGDAHQGVRAYKALADAGDLDAHLAVAIAVPMQADGVTLDAGALIALRDQNRARNVDTGFTKIFLDGVPTAARTAAMLADYLPGQTGGPAHNGKLLLDPEALHGLVTELDRLGFGIVIHVAGDRAVRVALDAIAQARERNGAFGPRHQLAHAGFIDPQDLPRFAALNVTADQSPYLWYPSPIIDSIVGALGERGRHYWPVKSLLDAGAHVVAGSDWPAVLPDMNPWIGIEALVSRAHPRAQYPGSFWPEQAVSLEQALRIMTLNGAVALGLEKITGSIEAGKSADLIILNHNLFEIPVVEVSETQVHTTYFEGRVVYSGAAAERPAP